MHNITVVVEKNDEEGFMKKDSIRLVEVGGQIAHTLTPRPGDINVQHCNLVIEFKDLKTMSYTEVNKLGNVTEEKNIPNVIELGNEKFFNFIYKVGEEWWLIRIRKLTPRECWRLMGFYDEDFDKAEKVNSNTQLYKQAGNSIVVNVLEEIFKQMM